MFCAYTRTRYQRSVYRTIGLLVILFFRVKPALPLPDSIRQLGTADLTAGTDDASNHDGRIRSFPHDEGNWATLVYIPCKYYNSLFSILHMCLCTVILLF